LTQSLPGCTRSSERVRIETHRRLQLRVETDGCTRSSERVRIETHRSQGRAIPPQVAPALRSG